MEASEDAHAEENPTMAQNPDKIGREVLPIPDTPSRGKMALDARDASFPPITPLRPPKGAPNVVIVLLDDMGFGAPSVTGVQADHGQAIGTLEE